MAFGEVLRHYVQGTALEWLATHRLVSESARGGSCRPAPLWTQGPTGLSPCGWTAPSAMCLRSSKAFT